MSAHDLQRAADAEVTGDRVPVGAQRSEERTTSATAWEGYSLDTLAALLDFDGLPHTDW